MSLASGSLPPGLGITGLTIKGTPTQPGVYLSTLKFSDSASNTFTVGVTLQVGPVLTITPTVLNFTASPGGPAPAPQSIQVTTDGASASFSTVVGTDDGSNWLSASVDNNNFKTTGSVTVRVQPAILAAGIYRGYVRVTAPGAIGSPLNTSVTIVVGTSSTLRATPSAISVTSSPGQPVQVNAAVSVFTTTAPAPIDSRVFDGTDWLTVKQIGTTSPVTLLIKGQRTTAGKSFGIIRVDAPNNSPPFLDIPVTATVPKLTPGPNIVTFPPVFYAYPPAVDFVSPNLTAQSSFLVANLGDTAAQVTASGDAVCGVYYNGSGPTTFPCPVTFTLPPGESNAVGFIVPDLGSGVYDVSVCASAPGTSPMCRNVPITVVSSGPLPAESAIYFRSQGGLGTVASAREAALTGGSRLLEFSNPTSSAAPYSTDTGGTPWLTVSPASGVFPAKSLSDLTLNFNTTGLAAGTYFGSFKLTTIGTTTIVPVSLQVQAVTPVFEGVGALLIPGSTLSAAILGKFLPPVQGNFNYTCVLSDGSVCSVTNTAQGLTVTVPAGSGLRTGTALIDWGTTGTTVVNLLVVDSAAGCKAASLAIAPDSLGPYFQVQALRPVQIRALVTDDCGQPVTSGTVIASLGGNTIYLTHFGGGIWSGTWVPSSAQQGDSAVTFNAFSPAGLTGQAAVSGTITAPDAASAPRVDHIANDADGSPAHFAPGTRFSLTGEGFSGSSTKVLLGGTSLPLTLATDTYMEGYIPADYGGTGAQQLLVQRDGVYSAPIPVVVAATAPAIYLLGDGTPQGRIYFAGSATLAAPPTTGGAGPATSGSLVIIPCTGLGKLADQTNPDGTQAPSVAPTVTIGGVVAKVSSSFVLPGWPGLYWLTVVIPDGVTAGDQVPVIVSSGGKSSLPATIAVR